MKFVFVLLKFQIIFQNFVNINISIPSMVNTVLAYVHFKLLYLGIA